MLKKLSLFKESLHLSFGGGDRSEVHLGGRIGLGRGRTDEVEAEN